MKYYFTLAIILFLSTVSLAQDGWFFQNPYPQGNTLYDVFIFDENTAIAVGNEGTIIKTTDDGANWRFQLSGNARNLQSVHFINNQVGWTVGKDGSEGIPSIFKTTDGGATWFAQFYEPVDSWTSVFFIDENNGWAVGNTTIIKTTDGGTNWTGTTIDTSEGFNDIYFVNLDVGWAIGSTSSSFYKQSIFKTTDGGDNWIDQTTQLEHALYSVYFIDVNTGWAAGNWGTILKTTNGGETWEEQTSNTANSLERVYFKDANTGWIAGTSGVILNTADGGATWNHLYIEPYKNFYSIAFHNTGLSYAVGESGTIVKSTDWGDNWTALSHIFTSKDLKSVFFIDENNGWVVGVVGTILKTSDSGSNWTEQISGTSNQLQAVYFINSDIGWTVGEDGTILHTTNEGMDWNPQTSGTVNWLNEVFFFNNSSGWAVGTFGTLLRTTNGGDVWESQIYDEVYYFQDVHFIDENTGWTVANDGLILKTTDGGVTWNPQNSPTSLSLNAIYFIDDQTGWFAGQGIRFPLYYHSRIGKTTNGGQNWALQENDSYADLYSIYFADTNRGWTVGQWGTILHTTNVGKAWEFQQSLTSNEFESLFFIDDVTGWAVGEYGVILKTTDGGGVADPVADFTVDKTVGILPITVQFTDLSTGDITFRYWDFGDNQTSMEQNPSHTYETAGIYTVSLKVTGPGGIDTETKVNYITISEQMIFLTHDTGSLKVSVFDNGNIGHLGTYAVGDGVVYSYKPDALFTGGVLFGTTSRGSINGHVGSFGVNDDLVNVSLFSLFEDLSPDWNQVSRSTFEDSNAPQPYGITIDQISYSSIRYLHGVVIQYRLYGNTTALNDLYVGIFADWDIGGEGAYDINLGGYDVSNNMAYQYVSDGTNDPYYYGVVALNGLAGARVTDTWAPDFARDSSFVWMTTFLNESITTPSDYRMWIGSGPFSLAVDDTLDVAFAVVAGISLNLLNSHASSIIEKYELYVPIDNKSKFSQAPRQFQLYKNYPNPFNPSTIISYDLPKSCFVSAIIYNCLGQKIETLINKQQSPGTYNVTWHADNLPTGLYFCRLEAGEFTGTIKLILQK